MKHRAQFLRNWNDGLLLLLLLPSSPPPPSPPLLSSSSSPPPPHPPAHHSFSTLAPRWRNGSRPVTAAPVLGSARSHTPGSQTGNPSPWLLTPCCCCTPSSRPDTLDPSPNEVAAAHGLRLKGYRGRSDCRDAEEGGPWPTPLAWLRFSPFLCMASLPTEFLLWVLPPCPQPHHPSWSC